MSERAVLRHVIGAPNQRAVPAGLRGQGQTDQLTRNAIHISREGVTA
ncbi:MAG: hypothetical protein ACR2LF_05825 [Jatrophihabitantaceae bacterium]